uniref:Uncharacterized protein n=1 Tax=Panagrolaimus davidi TaxID=227884 RepID=A0A914P793_9BILA
MRSPGRCSSVAEFNCKLIHSKPRHSQSQGSVERANRDIQDMLTILKQRCNTLFGRESVFGKTGELEEAIYRNAEEADKVTEYKNHETESLYHIGEDYGNDMDEDNSKDTDEEIGGDIDELAESLNNIQRNTSSARKAAKKQADKMQEASNKRFAVLKVGDNVRLPLPDVDRGKTDHRNVMGVIVDVKNGFYIVGTFAVQQRFLNVEDVPQIEAKSLLTVANLASTSEGQGHVHCNCQNMRCKCLSNDRRCNSRCHNSNTWRNKFDD